jgi:iron complex outermembrane receptor protein
VTPLGRATTVSTRYAADWTISGGVSHDFRLKSGISGARRHESQWWADYAHSLGVRQRPYAKANAP